MELLNIYKKERGAEPLFSDRTIVSWYDGIVIGICKLKVAEEWYICNLCYFNPSTYERIWTLVFAETPRVNSIQRQFEAPENQGSRHYRNVLDEIAKAFYDSTSAVFLMRAKSIDDVNYEIVELPKTEKKFFKSVEETIYQNKRSSNRWKSFFENSSF